MAATLLQMKSEAMLPTMMLYDDDETVMTREELVRQLLEYKKFKDAASLLLHKEEDQKNVYTRSFVEPGMEDFDLKEFRIQATLFDLLSAFRAVLQDMPEDQLTEFREDTVTVQQKMDEIIRKFETRKRIEFATLLSKASSRLEVIVTFLAILELMRTRNIIGRQSHAFSKIWLYRRRD